MIRKIFVWIAAGIGVLVVFLLFGWIVNIETSRDTACVVKTDRIYLKMTVDAARMWIPAHPNLAMAEEKVLKDPARLCVELPTRLGGAKCVACRSSTSQDPESDSAMRLISIDGKPIDSSQLHRNFSETVWVILDIE